MAGEKVEEKSEDEENNTAPRKRLVQSDSSEDEETAHQAKGRSDTAGTATALQSAQAKPCTKGKTGKNENLSSDDAEEEDFESSSESEESDEDFESDDDDFKGKKCKGSKQQVAARKSDVKSTTSRAAALGGPGRKRQVSCLACHIIRSVHKSDCDGHRAKKCRRPMPIKLKEAAIQRERLQL